MLSVLMNMFRIHVLSLRCLGLRFSMLSGLMYKTSLGFVLLHVYDLKNSAYQLFFSADTQQATLVQDPEERVHHAHGPTKHNQDPDDVCPKNMGGVPPKPPIRSWGPIIQIAGACNAKVNFDRLGAG